MKKLLLSLLSIAILSSSSIPVFANRLERSYNSDQDLGSIEATLTSAIDGEPFTAYFNEETGIATFVGLEGEDYGYRYVENEAAFQDLVELNAEITSQSIEGRIAAAMTDGQVGPRADFAPFFFDSGIFNVFVPSGNNPVHGNTIFTLRSLTSERRIDVTTQLFPTGMHSIDIFITNVIGDDFSRFLSVGTYDGVWHNISSPGEIYSVRVNSIWGSFSNVPLRVVFM